MPDHRRWSLSAVAAIVAVAAFGSASPAQAQWKWRDRAGHVQYSDLPPPSGTPEHDILQKPAAARRTADAPPVAIVAASGVAAPPLAPAGRASDPELEARRKKVEQESADRRKAEDDKQAAARAQAKAENCARAQEAKRTVDSGIRMTRTNKEGEREYLDDAARAAEGRRAQQLINSDCR